MYIVLKDDYKKCSKIYILDHGWTELDSFFVLSKSLKINYQKNYFRSQPIF